MLWRSQTRAAIVGTARALSLLSAESISAGFCKALRSSAMLRRALRLSFRGM